MTDLQFIAPRTTILSLFCRKSDSSSMACLVKGAVLGIVYRSIVTHLNKKAGFTKPTAQTGAVPLIPRFVGAARYAGV